jgi:uncharacterized protein YecT (DUF1311 family)
MVRLRRSDEAPVLGLRCHLRMAIVAACLSTLASSAPAASFDCMQASKPVEQAICASARLSTLDERLSTSYKSALAKASGAAEKRAIRAAQAGWLRSRDACGANELCIEVMYRTRLVMLGNELSSKGHGQDVASGSQFGTFWITFGVEEKVCVAYLERLNRSSYDRHPKCDRPSSHDVPGFERLDEASLSAAEILPYWASVESFLSVGRADRWRAVDASNRKLGLPPQYGDRSHQLQRLRSEMAIRLPFHYEKGIDIDNDGVHDPIVVWRTGECRRVGALNEMRYWTSIPIVLNAAGDGPDVERTRLVFGHPLGGYRLSSGEIAERFRPIGRQMSIFEYEGTYYMDAFYDGWGDLAGLRQFDAQLGRNDPEIAMRLAVLKRAGGKTTQVCEYWFDNGNRLAGASAK